MIALTFDAHRRKARPPHLNPLAVDVPEIVEWIEAKEPRAIEDWNELGASEYARSFTAARTTGHDIIRDLYDGLLAEMRDEQPTESGFVERMMPVLRQKGWLPELDDKAMGRRLRLIYDTNIRTSMAVGKWRSFQRTKQYLPYLRYSAVQDNRTRPAHAALHDIILPVEHPLWRIAFAPAHFNCRCVVTALSRSQAARYGGPSGDNRANEAARIVEQSDQFWGYNPGILADQAAVAQVQRVNERRIPGSPPIFGTLSEGRSLWQALFAGIVAGLLDRLFED
ncbi:MAG: minor capsid protein [Sphingomonas sp.]|nr:minor capsid protein [Sphingomonas sp.]